MGLGGAWPVNKIPLLEGNTKNKNESAQQIKIKHF